MAEDKAVVVNRSQGKTFHLKGGRSLGPGESIESSGKELKMLLGYREIVDAAKLTAKKGTVKAEAPAEEPAEKKGKK